MSNTINLDDYVSDEEKKDIAVRVFSDRLRETLNIVEIERIVSNNSYEIAQRLVDENFNKEFKQAIKKKLPEIINNLTGYTVFNQGDTYGAFAKEATLGWKMVEQAVRENEIMLKKRVAEVVAGIDEATLKDKISEAIYEAVVEPITPTQRKDK